MKLDRSNTLFCFSPAVMIATVIIELSLALWILVRYIISTPQRIMIALLVCLAAFQIAEFNVCSSNPVDIIWSRLGYCFITLLPALGLDLTARIRGDGYRNIVRIGYILATGIILGFAFLPSGLNTGVCKGNYVVFLLKNQLAIFYAVYYFGLEVIGLALALSPIALPSKQKHGTLKWMAASYISFMLPTLIIYYVLPATRNSIPSIMCGFAVVVAIIIGLRVAPRISTIR